jgi:hypothetical protein
LHDGGHEQPQNREDQPLPDFHVRHRRKSIPLVAVEPTASGVAAGERILFQGRMRYFRLLMTAVQMKSVRSGGNIGQRISRVFLVKRDRIDQEANNITRSAGD